MQNKPSDNNKRIAKNTLFLYVRMVVVMLITLYTTRALLGVLGISDYGIYNVVCGLVSMFGFLNTSMANGVQRFYNYELGKGHQNQISKIYSHAVAIQFLLSLIIIIIVETVGVWYLNNKLVIPNDRVIAANWIFHFSMVNLLFVVISVPYSAAIMAYEKMNFYAVVSIMDAVLKLLIVYILPYISSDNLIMYGLLITSISIMDFILNFSYCRTKFSELKFHVNFKKDLFGSMLSFSGWNIFGSFAHMFKNQGLNLVLNSFWGTAINAANGVAGQVNAAVNSLTANFLTAVRPQMIKSYASGNMDYLMKMLYSTSKLTFYLVMILAIPLILEIEPILNFWLGVGKYPEETISFCRLTILITLFDSFATPISTIVHASGKMKKFQIVCSSVILLVVPLAYISSRLGGSAEMTLAMGIFVTIATQFVRLHLISNIIDFSERKYYIKVFLPTQVVFIISLATNYAIYKIMPDGILYLFILFFTAVLVSSVAIFLIGINTSEKRIIVSFLKK